MLDTTRTATILTHARTILDGTMAPKTLFHPVRIPPSDSDRVKQLEAELAAIKKKDVERAVRLHYLDSVTIAVVDRVAEWYMRAGTRAHKPKVFIGLNDVKIKD